MLKLFHLPALIQYNSLFRKLVYRDFFERFAGSALGVLWTILNPLVLMGMYVLLFSVILKVRYEGAGTYADFGLFLFCGMIPYSAFQEAVLKASDTVLKYRSFILQVRFPRAFLPLHIAFSSMLQAGIAYTLFWLLCLWQQPFTSREPWHLFWILPFGFLFTAGICQIVSGLSVFYRDLAQLLNLALMMGFFASPIVYPPERVPPEWLDLWQLNPFVHFIGAARACLLGQGTIQSENICFIAGWSLGVYFIGTLIYERLSKNFYRVL